MSKRTKVILIVAALVVTAYLAYRYYTNKQQAQQNNNTSGLGSNLNSVAPEMVGGSSGPDSGLNYYGGTTVVDLSMPQTNKNNSGPPDKKSVTHKKKAKK